MGRKGERKEENKKENKERKKKKNLILNRRPEFEEFRVWREGNTEM